MCPVVSRLDEANQALVANVGPDVWRNPAPPGVYDLIAIGGGTAGLSAPSARPVWARAWRSSGDTCWAAIA